MKPLFIILLASIFFISNDARSQDGADMSLTVGGLFDMEDTGAASAQVHMIVHKLIHNLRVARMLPQKPGQTTDDVMKLQTQIADWMREYYGNPMTPNHKAYEDTIFALADADSGQKVANVVMGYIFSLIKAQQNNLTEQKKKSTQRP